MLTDDEIQKVKDHLRNMTDAEFDEIMEELIRDGIMDRDGNVLVRMPEGPPEWARPANEVPDATKNGKPEKKRRR
jgi:hypothetical protein